MAPGKPFDHRSKYGKYCPRPYCRECRPRFLSFPVTISEVKALEIQEIQQIQEIQENARNPEVTVPVLPNTNDRPQVSTEQQVESVVHTPASTSFGDQQSSGDQAISMPSMETDENAQNRKEEKLVETFKDIDLNN